MAFTFFGMTLRAAQLLYSFVNSGFSRRLFKYWWSWCILPRSCLLALLISIGPFIYYVSKFLGFLDPTPYVSMFLVKINLPKFQFHRITSSYNYFEEFEFMRQFSKKQNMIKKKYQLNRNEKFVEKAQQCFTFLHIKPKFKFAVQS